MLQTAEEPLEHRRKLRFDVGEREELLVQQMATALAVPLQTILLAGAPVPLDDEPHGICEALRGMRNPAGQEENLSRADGNIDGPALLDGLEQHVTLDLVEELLARVHVIVLARVGSPHDLDDEVAVAVDTLVADRRLQQMPVVLYPAAKIDGLKRLLWHTVCPVADSRMVSPGAPAERLAGPTSLGGKVRALSMRLPALAGAVMLTACSHLHWPWRHRPPPPPELVHELVITSPTGTAQLDFPQYWKRNTLVLDLQGVSGTGGVVLHPAPGTTWPVRLAVRVRPGTIGQLEVRADQRLVIPIIPGGAKPVDLELVPGVYTSKTEQILVSWAPATPP